MAIPQFLDLYRTLISLPTISSLEAEHDQSNRTLINTLADWLATLGFKTEIIAVEGTRDKYIIYWQPWVKGTVVYCWRGTPTLCRLIRGAGLLIRLN